MKLSRICFALSTVIILGMGISSAQSAQGRIQGRVTDASGAVISKAKVTVTNTGTNISRELEANGAGEYNAPNLSPGFYAVSASAPSFKTLKRTGIQLEVASELQIDLQLQAGGSAEVIEVTGDAPLVNLVDDTLGGDFNNKLINELPLQGRDFQNLLELTPGIQRTPGGGFHSVTTNGLRYEENNYTVDGTDDNDLYYGESVINGVGVSGTPASHLPLDAIQEFNTQENQGSEYGWKPGAVVNIGIKSGTNDLHGTGYYFTRNSAFDARNYFNPGPQPVSDLILHDFGASAGGPIIKDKWFIFGTYEGIRHKVGNPGLIDTPVTSSLGSGIDDAALSLADAKTMAGCPAACSPVSLQLAQLFENNPGPNTGFNFNFDNKNREDNFIIKSDYHLNSKNTISGHYFYANSLQTEEDTLPIRPEWLSIADTKVGVAGFNWTFAPNSRWVNEARFGFNRTWQSDNVGDRDKSADSYGLNTGVTDPMLFGFPDLEIGSLFEMGGNGSWPLFTSPTRTYQIADNASVSVGHHNLKFGGEYRWGGSDVFRARRGRGRIVFDDTRDPDSGDITSPALVNFLQGNFGDEGFAQILTGSEINRKVSMSAFGLFVNDDWRIKPRLSLNLGLRYDISFPLKEAHDGIANFIPSMGGIIQVGDGISSPYPTDKNNISPRLGIAWDVFGTGKTVIRAGGALIYSQPVIREFIDRSGLQNNPSGLAGVTPGTGNITTAQREIDDVDALSSAWLNKTPLFASAQSTPCDFFDQCDVVGVSTKLATPYVASWNFNIQQQLAPSTSLQIAYVATRGIKLYSHRDTNQPDPIANANCYFNDDDSYRGCRRDTRPFKIDCDNNPSAPCLDWVGYVTQIENSGSSFYNGLQVTLTQKTHKGLNFIMGYTWAHSLDNGTSNRTGFPQDNRTFAPEWGNSDTDIRHRFTLSLSYDLPKFKAPIGLGNGWQVTSIVNLQTGEPYSYFDDNNDISFSGEFLDRWDFSGNPNDVHWTVDPSKQIQYIQPDDAVNNSQCTSHVRPGGDLASFGCFVSGSAVITPQPYGTFGNMRRNIFRGPAYANWDMSVTKRWKLTERLNLQLRGEFFNVLNHPNFDIFTMGTDLADPVSGDPDLGVVRFTPDVGVSNPVIGSGGSRHIQLGAKFIW